LENNIFQELNEYYKNHNLTNFDMRIESSEYNTPSIDETADTLNLFQEIIFALGSISKKLEKGTQIGKDMRKSLSIGIDNASHGSLKLELKPVNSQTELFPYLGLATDRLNDIINCGEDIDLLEKQAKKLGSKPIFKYKKFLENIKNKEITVSLFDNIKPKNFEKKILDPSFANKVEFAINNIKPIKNSDEKIIEGKLDVINGRKGIISINLEKEKGDKGDHLDIIFDKNKFDKILGEKYEKDIKINVEVIEIDSVVDGINIEYELLDFIE